MKWIGQHIWDFISRFRSDVYLEDISTGTIASGSNLGLDSNNKIVKSSGGVTGPLSILEVDDITLDGKTIRVKGDDDDIFTITAAAAGATTLTTVDAVGNSGHFEVVADGNIILDTSVAGGNINFQSANTTYAFFDAHHNTSYLTMYEDMGASTDDYFMIAVAASGATKLLSIDAAGEAAHFEIAADGDITLDAEGQIKLEPLAGSNILLDGTVTVDGGSVTGITTLGVDSVSLTAIQTSGESFVDNDTSLMTSAAIDDKINTKYSYAYMTWSASATSSMDGSDPEWVFPNAAKGIYEEDWSKDENIKATSVGTTTYTTSRHTVVNSFVVPHTGICVGFHAHGRNNTSDATFKTGLFHYEGSSTGTTNASGIDYGATGTTHECTLRWIATAAEAESSGGADGTSADNFKGPCKLVSNADALAVTAGDALMPAIMGPDGSDEIFVTMTIILKVPLTT